MSKAILLSVRPFWAYLIWKLLKTLELRKIVPKFINMFVYIYVTITPQDLKKIPEEHREMVKSWMGKVPMRFWFDEYSETSFDYIIHLDDVNGVDEDDYDGCDIYGRPNPLNDNLMNDYLSQFMISYNNFINYVGNKKAYAWHIKNLEIFDEPMELSDFAKHCKNKNQVNKYWVHKAPQSYQYVYVKEK